MKKIKANLRINPVIILVSWSLMVLLPFICLKTALFVFFGIEFSQNKTRIEPILYSELQSFRQDLDERKMLKEKLLEFDSRHGFKYSEGDLTSKIEKEKILSALHLRKLLEKHLNFSVLAVMNYSPDIQKIDFSLNTALQSHIKRPPKIMMKRMFSILAQQNRCNPVYPETFKPAFPVGTDLDTGTTKNNYTGNFLQLTFGTIFPHYPKPGQLLETAASKTGLTGNIFFYYSEKKMKSKNGVHNLGGYLAVIRLQDIPENMIVKFATKRNLFPDIKRKTIFLKKQLTFPESYEYKDISRFYEFEDRYALVTMLPQIAIVRRIQKGTILPKSFADFSNKVVAVETSISKKKLQHELQRYQKEFIFLSYLFILFGSFLFIRLWLFGMDFSASISLKIFAAAFCICLIPISSLYTLNLVYIEQEKNAISENMKNYLESKTAYIERKVITEMRNYRQKTVQLGKTILSGQKYDNRSIEKILEPWCVKNCANGANFQKFEQRFFSYTTPECKADKAFMQSWELKKIFFNSVVEFILSSKLINQKAGIPSSLLTDGSNNAESVHQMLSSGEKLITIARVSKNSRLSGYLIKEIVGSETHPIAMLAVDYNVKKVLNEVYKSTFKDFEFTTKLTDFTIDLGIFSADNNILTPIAQCFSPNLQASQIVKLLEKRSGVKKKLFWKETTDKHLISSIVKFSPQLPFVIFAQSKKEISSSQSSSNAFIWIYPILVLLITLLLSNLFFISPTRSLANSLSEIASGNLNHKINLKSKDEFEALSNEFNLMTKSLIEKEKLEKFVSPALLEEINRNTESVMTPGGEKIEATVLFSSIRKKVETDAPLSPEKAVAQLDIFLGICNAICTQNHGVIDKLIGNTIMMVFRGKFDDTDHTSRACIAAQQITEALSSHSHLYCSSGLSSGLVVSGKIGSKTGKLDYTVIGDTVNMAARLKSLAEKESKSSIIISQSIFAKVDNSFIKKELAAVKIKGKTGEFRVFELV